MRPEANITLINLFELCLCSVKIPQRKLIKSLDSLSVFYRNMIKSKQDRPPHEKSHNLSDDENESLFQLIDKEDGVVRKLNIVKNLF